ncbi:alpha/beta fold hydrolase [Polaribacter butkevichii]|uniref:Serine aminopeptidase S33 domain-containing protein n=1 Tax=Polaribacter butkevichii TaxID=218490 RepID=A0A2P6C6R2_9FLAO|nr:alpha/beta fold hydrolase [Polaribacter butkevichii]PQJ68613.1 hypothetical protein BTO14_11140 [Polaribacter butkevichii]
MKIVLTTFLLFISTFIFSQEKFNNEKEIKNTQNYNIQEISKKVNETITIFGTLLTPKSNYNNILVILSGTGKTSQKAHNYLTNYLLKNNIGVFKFDKRGVGKSTGEYNDQPKIYTSDFIGIYSELRKLEPIKNKKIGFLGHSLGGIVTTMAIEQNVKPDFLIQWSAPIGKPRELLGYQIKNGIKNYNKSIIGKNKEEQIKSLNYIHHLIDKNPNKTALELWKIAKKESKKVNINKKSFSNYLTPIKVEFARINNTKTYQNIDFPTLVIIGEEDILVDPKQSKVELNEIGNSNIIFKEIKNLNHFMTKKGTSQLTNEIYNVDISFKKYLVNWIASLKS